MQNNGTIQYKLKSGGGRDEDGDPIPVTATWSEPIGCLIRKLKHSYQYMSEGKYEQASYEVFIEQRDFSASFVLLTDSKGRELGEFEVQDISDVNRSGRIVVTV